MLEGRECGVPAKRPDGAAYLWVKIIRPRRRLFALG